MSFQCAPLFSSKTRRPGGVTLQWVEDIDLEWQGCQFDWPRPLVSTEVSLWNYVDVVDAIVSGRSRTKVICNAFAGICGAVAEEVLWGLPCIAFERYPTWGPGAAGRHRAADASSYLGSPAGPGSRGAGTYVWGVAASMRRGLQKLCYRWDSDIQDLPPISSAPAEPLPSATEQGEIPTSRQCKKKDIPPDLVLNNAHIVFWASVAQFIVQTDESGYLSLFLPSPSPYFPQHS
jgi:hypothetical protein